ncbi:MAG: DUF87 domain-containing protein, partial [Muribaculaceae bacterium]|nr:DUF87 domain-containing protein [Muribaculaceae bacterium]
MENYHKNHSENEMENTLNLPISQLSDGTNSNSDEEKYQSDIKQIIIETLMEFGFDVIASETFIGPTHTLHEFHLEEGVCLIDVRENIDNIRLMLRDYCPRIIAPIPGKGAIGIEVANKYPRRINFQSVTGSEIFRNCQYYLPVIIGVNIKNEVIMADLVKMPHLLIGGETGSGKSVFLNIIMASLLLKKQPGDVKFVLIDPKGVEFGSYRKLKDYLFTDTEEFEDAIVIDSESAKQKLENLCNQMEYRYSQLREAQSQS